MFSRRELIKSASVVAVAAALPMAKLASAAQLKIIGIRPDALPPEDYAKAFDAYYAMGYRETEATYAGALAAVSAYQACPLKKIACALPGAATAPGKEDDLNRALDQIKEWGFTYTTHSAGGGRPDAVRNLDKYRVFLDSLNRIGEKSRAAGLGKVLYHSMVFEFEPMEGTTGFQLIMDGMDKKLCGSQMDVYWVKLSGNNPAELLRKYAGQVVAIHMKDQPAGFPVMYQHAPGDAHANFLDVGSGSMDWPSIVRAAVSSGVKHFTVEPDARPGNDRYSDNIEGGQKSWDYLSKLNV